MLQKMFDLFEKCVREIVGDTYFKVRIIYAALGTFIFSMAANGFAYFNFYPQHDSLNHTFLFADIWEVRLGRFLLPLYGKLRGNITMPWLFGMLSIVYLVIITYLICDVLNVKNKWEIFFIAGFLSTNITITQLCSVFMYVIDAYMLALLFAVAGVWFMKRLTSWRGKIGAIICFIVSMGLYQAYMVIAVIFFMLIICIDLLTQKDAWKTCIVKWLSYVGVLVISAGLYLVCYKMALFFCNVQAATSKNSISSIVGMDIKELLILILVAYKNFLQYFLSSELTGNVARFSSIVLGILAISQLVKYIKRNEIPLRNYICICIAGALYPGISLLMGIMMKKSVIDWLVSYGIGLVYPILLVIIFNMESEGKGLISSKIKKRLAIILSSVIIFANISFSNGAYTVQKIMYDRTLSVMTRMMEDIDRVDGYIPGETAIVLIGIGKPTNIEPLTEKYSSLRAFKSLSTSYSQTFKSFAAYMGYDVIYQSDNDAMQQLELVQDMPCYPYAGYCKMVDGKLVVKLSE